MKLITMVALLMATWSSASRAEPVLAHLGLFSGRTVVSGQGEANRQNGFTSCMLDVLAKVSGDPMAATDPLALSLASRAIDYVASYSYRDRLEGRPVHDEQGTYDRPHYLTVNFDPAKLESALRSIGRKPWLHDRPQVLVVVTVQGRRRSFVLSSNDDVDVSSDMRASLANASDTTGVPYHLPNHAELTSADVTVEQPQARLNSQAKFIAAGKHLNASLVGALEWSDTELGWIANWHLNMPAASRSWDVRGVSFDEAFRQGLWGVAQSFAGAAQ